jgi:hypothetical protein
MEPTIGASWFRRNQGAGSRRLRLIAKPLAVLFISENKADFNCSDFGCSFIICTASLFVSGQLSFREARTH